MAVSTVCAVLKRLGLNRLWKLGPPEPPNRYCRRHAGELVHVDVKKLGRFHRARQTSAGSSVPAATTSAAPGGKPCTSASMTPPASPTSKCSPTNTRSPPSAFFERAVAWFAERGITVRQVLSDNGSPYLSARLGHRGARRIASSISAPGPTGPSTNGKAERFIQTMLPRVGLRRDLSHLSPPRPCTARLDRLLQPPTTTRRPRPQDTRQPASRRLTNVNGNYT